MSDVFLMCLEMFHVLLTLADIGDRARSALQSGLRSLGPEDAVIIA